MFAFLLVNIVAGDIQHVGDLQREGERPAAEQQNRAPNQGTSRNWLLRYDSAYTYRVQCVKRIYVLSWNIQAICTTGPAALLM